MGASTFRQDIYQNRNCSMYIDSIGVKDIYERAYIYKATTWTCRIFFYESGAERSGYII